MSYYMFVHRPGAYEFDAKRDRKVKFHGSFGGPQTLITSVTIKCNDFGEPDIVSISLIVAFFHWPSPNWKSFDNNPLVGGGVLRGRTKYNNTPENTLLMAISMEMVHVAKS